jgi:hypothetical protein
LTAKGIQADIVIMNTQVLSETIKIPGRGEYEAVLLKFENRSLLYARYVSADAPGEWKLRLDLDFLPAMAEMLGKLESREVQ